MQEIYKNFEALKKKATKHTTNLYVPNEVTPTDKKKEGKKLSKQSLNSETISKNDSLKNGMTNNTWQSYASDTTGGVTGDGFKKKVVLFCKKIGKESRSNWGAEAQDWGMQSKLDWDQKEHRHSWDIAGGCD